MKRIRIDARQSDLDELENILHHFVQDDHLEPKQTDVLEALKLAIIDATKRRIEHQTETINYYYDNSKNK
jgi:hypothetical protein